ncbi:MAG: succinate dehydrogenase cytochrome b subunit [candidate division Zixibacteria bacterium]|nr:succinate dehydrogenase cytochrome b subunit [candidate division Zixibacteria bacterium]
MAITGFVAFGYIIGHMLGNLQIFIGPDQINAYAKALHMYPALLWVVRSALIVAFGLHIWLGAQLKLENLAARPVAYERKNTVKATLASRTMIWTGLTIFAFVVYHILHFTATTVNPAFEHLTDAQGRHDTYSMVILGFQSVPVAVMYLISVGLVCYHLSHGIASMFQSIGWNNRDTERWFRIISVGISTIVFLGFSAVPVAVLAGYLQPLTGGN